MPTLSLSFIFTTLLSFIAFFTITQAQTCANPNTLVVPPTFSFLPSTAQFTSCPTGHDGPKVSPIDQTAYDWWYFDAVSTDGTESIVVVFFTASAAGFPFEFTSLVDATTVAVFATFADGTSSLTPLLATGAKITTVGDGASGVWNGAGAKFDGASDLSTYDVSIDNLLARVHGTFHLESHGPGHYPCSPLAGGVAEELVPHVGWVNVMPAATGTVDFTINGKELSFTGPAYHDKNWGDIPFTSAVRSWYWGHGTLGPYHLVWFDAIDGDGNESVSGYVVENGDAVGATCDNLRVRPVGTPYPPGLLTADPDQFTIVMELNDGSEVNATVTTKETQIDFPGYLRWIGEMEGTIGGVRYEGSALWEQFKLRP